MIQRSERGLRVYVLGRRIHHAVTGIVLTATGLILIWHDRKDYPWSFKDKV